VGVSCGLLDIPYQLPLLSYSSVPVLALVLGIAAGFAVTVTRSWRWAFLLGLVAAGASACVPLLVPAWAAVLLLPLLMVRCRHASFGALAGVLVVSVPFLAWLLSDPVLSSLRETIDYTLAYQDGRLSPRARLQRATYSYEVLGAQIYVPVLVAIGVALIGCLKSQWSRLRIAGTALGMAWAGLLPLLSIAGLRPELAFGQTVSALAPVLVLILMAPVLADALWQGQRHELRLLLLSSVPAVLAVPLLASTTYSGPQYSIHGSGLAGLLLALGSGWIAMCCRTLRAGVPSLGLGAIPVITMALLLSALPFQEPASWHLGVRIAHGPWSGLVTTPERKASLIGLQSLIERSAPGRQHLMLVGFPGGTLVGQHVVDSNILWLVDYGAANAAVLRWMVRRQRVPDVVLVNTSIEAEAGGTTAWASRDPLRAWIDAEFVVSDGVPGLATVYVRKM